jgi:hypothetical protein
MILIKKILNEYIKFIMEKNGKKWEKMEIFFLLYSKLIIHKKRTPFYIYIYLY